MADSQILDHNGRPIQRKVLTDEVARASLTGVRSVWNHESVANGLTPQRLGVILREAIEGDADAYFTLAEEMEERDLHYSAVLGTRKLAVIGLDPQVDAATDDAHDIELADAVRDLIARPEFDDMLFDCLDGLGKGRSAVEILWQRGATWWPRKYVWRDPRFFQEDRVEGEELRLKDDTNAFEGLPLPPYKFIVHKPKRKSGRAIRNGLARLAATAYMCKAFSITDWLAFAEVFGMPIRVGKHGPNATEDDILTLINAVANIGSDAAAVIPDNMRIEFQEAGSSRGGESLFERLANYLDSQVSKAVLGQTMTTDAQSSGLGSNQADVHNDVRGDIQRFDAKQLQTTIQRDLIQPFIDLNFGPQERYPQFKLPVPDPEDLKLLVDALETLVPMGLEVEQSVMRDKLRLPDPAKGALLLQAPSQMPFAPIAQNQAHHCPACATAAALNRTESDPSYVDELETEALADWEAQMAPIVDPLEQLLAQSDSYEAFLEGLSDVLEEIEPTEIIERLATATLKARGLGDASDQQDRE
ncbi:Mu-like prophage FluMu protein gp29 [Alloalcanivorax xenomutans]|uniref:DUF935 domain-containing protein n=1 Tax=Alloalcanivorax xenomutans TaxID=1094342 RepID=UPI0006D5C6FE|nr:DUF935 domain-containing protein [Alloalcanivorax xenomutans]CUR45537.1 Mu-like prophage FluMu protein gp29 [Alloalcanivorax xenomutans]